MSKFCGLSCEDNVLHAVAISLDNDGFTIKRTDRIKIDKVRPRTFSDLRRALNALFQIEDYKESTQVLLNMPMPKDVELTIKRHLCTLTS